MDTMERAVPKYGVGDAFFIPTTKREDRKHDCPDCLGEKVFKVTSPAGGDFTMDCPRCGDRYGFNKVPSLRYSVYAPDVIECAIAGYSLNDWNEQGFTYKSKAGHTVHESKIIPDRDAAMQAAQLLAAEMNAKEASRPERMAIDHFAQLELKEASSDQFKSDLYDSWASYRHMREVIDGLLEEDQEHLPASEIRDSLRDVIETAHRYDFVFKGFTRAMETVVKLVNSDDAEAPEILTLLRERWSALPEQARNVWEPTFPQSRWLGDDVPTF